MSVKYFDKNPCGEIYDVFFFVLNAARSRMSLSCLLKFPGCLFTFMSIATKFLFFESARNTMHLSTLRTRAYFLAKSSRFFFRRSKQLLTLLYRSNSYVYFFILGRNKSYRDNTGMENSTLPLFTTIHRSRRKSVLLQRFRLGDTAAEMLNKKLISYVNMSGFAGGLSRAPAKIKSRRGTMHSEKKKRNLRPQTNNDLTAAGPS